MKIAVIPARGGSKRIPHKNIRPFHGKPMIAYSIDVAIRSGLFDQVVVSTDDPEIATVARQYGAQIPFMRPAELADDYTGTTPVVKYTIERLHKEYQLNIEYICCIYATAPFLDVDDLKQGYERVKADHHACAFSVTTFSFPILRSQKMNEDGSLSPFFPQYMGSRSQDLPEAYHDAGQFYWWHQQALFTGVRKSWPVILPRYRVQDIDTIEDWEYAELMMKVLCRNC